MRIENLVVVVLSAIVASMFVAAVTVAAQDPAAVEAALSLDRPMACSGRGRGRPSGLGRRHETSPRLGISMVTSLPRYARLLLRSR